MAYDLTPMRAPRLTGRLLRAFTVLLEGRLTRWALAPRLLRDAGIERFRAVALREPPSVRPDLPGRGWLGVAGASLRDGAPLAGSDVVAVPPVVEVAEVAGVAAGAQPPAGSPDDGARGRALAAEVLASWPAEAGPGFRFESVRDFAAAYREGRATPSEVARRVLDAVRASDRLEPPLRALIAWDDEDLLAQARASTARFRAGRPLGPLDGVPVAVKDELDQVPYPTTVGTRFLGKAPARDDATAVARLRAAGALLLGKANMHEIGIGVTGLNPHHGTARNPYDPAHHTGGSSSGSAAAVAAGLCPIAIGADGGGSIRTPAALCGVVGLKATFGRISEHGAYPLCWSVAHVGPLAATARDAAIAYAVLAGRDPRDPSTRGQPDPRLDGLAGSEAPDLRGVRLGVFRPWFNDAEPSVVAACERALAQLGALGAEVREVELPELELARVAHLITIASEMGASMAEHQGRHQTDHGLDVRVNLALTRLLSSRDYVAAQRARTRFTAHCERLLGEVDLILTPTCGRTAPPVNPAALAHGESDLVTTGALLRFVFPANLTGYPAVSCPAGYDARGLPIGLQVMARPWEEHLLLRVAAAVERGVERRAPPVHFRLLG